MALDKSAVRLTASPTKGAESARRAKEKPRDLHDGQGKGIRTDKARPISIHNYIIRICAACFVPAILVACRRMLTKEETGFMDSTSTNILGIDSGFLWFYKSSLTGWSSWVILYGRFLRSRTNMLKLPPDQ